MKSLVQIFKYSILTMLLSIPFSSADASVILKQDIQTLTRRSDRIVVGKAIAVTSAWTQDRKRIITEVTFAIDENWKGLRPRTNKIIIRQLGGIADGIEMTVHGMPRFQEGKRSLLFLQGNDHCHVAGMFQGKKDLYFDKKKRNWRTFLSQKAPEKIEIVDKNVRSKLLPSDHTGSISLDKLRTQIKTILRSKSPR